MALVQELRIGFFLLLFLVLVLEIPIMIKDKEEDYDSKAFVSNHTIVSFLLWKRRGEGEQDQGVDACLLEIGAPHPHGRRQSPGITVHIPLGAAKVPAPMVSVVFKACTWPS